MINSIFSDGGARGNPGPAASAFVVLDNAENILYKSSKYLGQQTNNYAEYQGVVLALTWLSENIQMIDEPIIFFMDSELVVKQINGIYKVKEPTLQKLNKEVASLIERIAKKIVFQNVPRAKNKLADSLVNEELDKSSS